MTYKKGPTPHGGDYSKIIYLDADGNKTTADHAVEDAVYEYKSDGTLIFDAHFLCEESNEDAFSQLANEL